AARPHDDRSAWWPSPSRSWPPAGRSRWPPTPNRPAQLPIPHPTTSRAPQWQPRVPEPARSAANGPAEPADHPASPAAATAPASARQPAQGGGWAGGGDAFGGAPRGGVSTRHRSPPSRRPPHLLEDSHRSQRSRSVLVVAQQLGEHLP